LIQAQKHSTKSNQPNNYSYKIQNIAMLSQSARVVARRVAPRVPAVAVQARGYHENIVEHYENPRNVGAFDKNDVNVGTVSGYFIPYDWFFIRSVIDRTQGGGRWLDNVDSQVKAGQISLSFRLSHFNTSYCDWKIISDDPIFLLSSF